MTFRTLLLQRPEGAAQLHLLLTCLSDFEVHVIAQTPRMTEIEAVCAQQRPDLIFYDPRLDDGAYLTYRQRSPQLLPVVVCFTQDVSYAVEAFEAGAVHYLLPTVDTIAVEVALQRVERRLHTYRDLAISEAVQKTLYQVPPSKPLTLHEPRSISQVVAQVIALPLQNGLDIRPCDQIVHVHGEGSYARVIFQRDPAVIVSRSIGDCEETLHDRGFLRVHRSHLVNLMHVRRMLRGKQPRLCMSNGDEIDVSEKHRDALMEHLHVIGRKRR